MDITNNQSGSNRYSETQRGRCRSPIGRRSRVTPTVLIAAGPSASWEAGIAA